MNNSYFHLNSFGIIQFTGKDCRTFLHSQFSNDILNLNNNEACYACYSSLKGRVIANFLVTVLDDNLLIIIKKDLITTLIKQLTFYRLRSQVDFFDVTNEYLILGKLTAQKPQPLPYPLKFKIISQSSHQYAIECPNGTAITILKNQPVDELINNENDWNAFEIMQGFTWVTAATSNQYIAQMLNLELLGAINFKKGCYLGQEIIVRSQHRGEVKRRPAFLSSNHHYSIGQKIYQNKIEVGTIINSATQANQYLYLAIVKNTITNDNLLTNQDDNNALLTLNQLFYYPKEPNE